MKTTKINFLKILLLFTMGIFLTNCSKDDDPPAAVLAPLQDPLAGYLTATGFSEKTDNFINSGDYEFGYSFIPLVNGKITDIVAKLPEARLAMRVTIWDKLAGSVLRTETIDVTIMLSNYRHKFVLAPHLLGDQPLLHSGKPKL